LASKRRTAFSHNRKNITALTGTTPMGVAMIILLASTSDAVWEPVKCFPVLVIIHILFMVKECQVVISKFYGGGYRRKVQRKYTSKVCLLQEC
jgi:hypothetical protein